MALIKCKECQAEISKSAKTCPQCGAKNKQGLGVLGTIFWGFIGLIVIGAMLPDTNTTSSRRVAVSSTGARVAPATTPGWQYSEDEDDMGRGKVKMAIIQSSNQVRFDFPYNGAQRGRLILRSHPKHGKDVIFGIEKGQFLCHLDGCNLEVKFGEGKPIKFHATAPSDNSTESVFIQNFDRFLANAKKADSIKIEATFYQEGNQVFEFKTAGLKW
jgi:hypothetical protein